MLTLKNIEYKASIIGILIMLALKNLNYKARIIVILMMLALKKINYKASIRGHSTTTWTNFDPILTPSPPRVDKRGHFTTW